MRHSFNRLLLIALLLLFLPDEAFPLQQKMADYDLMVIGGGTSGTTAAIQASRSGVKVLLLAEGPWLGGMLTSAGVSAIDGNHHLPSGLWGAFRSHIYEHYGGAEKVATGWVSHTLFEPAVGDSILKTMAAHPNLNIEYYAKWDLSSIKRIEGRWSLVYLDADAQRNEASSKLLIDATELGDVMAALGVPYDLGMDGPQTEHWAKGPNDQIQDLTWVGMLKDYGEGADRTIPKPDGYEPSEFYCACEHEENPDGMACETMLDYARLPSGQILLNWPNCGNDAYIDVVEMNAADRAEALEEARLQTLRFIYYIQTELGMKHLGPDPEVFPTGDGLALIPYHRESRRLQAVVQLKVDDLAKPYAQKNPLYRTGIAVGDYPIDHHHKQKAPGQVPQIEFIDIKVPAYSVPLGVMIPKEQEGLIVAEKSIGVTNIVNGTTRLQPVVMGIGQAAGALAAEAIASGKSLQEVSVRKVQQRLLDAGAYIMPYRDVNPSHMAFQAIQRVSAMGWMKGALIPYKWANEQWFYPNQPISQYDLLAGLQPWFQGLKNEQGNGSFVDANWLLSTLKKIAEQDQLVQTEQMETFNALALLGNAPLSRAQIAEILDKALKPFDRPIDLLGHPITQQATMQRTKAY